jgi:hypothetical protein
MLSNVHGDELLGRGVILNSLLAECKMAGGRRLLSY